MADVAYANDMEPIEPGLEEEAPQATWVEIALTSSNLADELSDQELAAIGGKVYDEYKMDYQSRVDAGWQEMYESSMKLAMQVKEAKSYPWQGAANIKYPLLTTSAIQFAARAYPAIVDGWNVVKGKVLGQPDDEKRDRADRIASHMSWQLLEEMQGWEEDTDKLLHMLPITGTVFRKTYFDPHKGVNCSIMVSAKDGVCDYWTRDMESCPRFTHVTYYYRNECEEKFRSGIWKRIELGSPDGDDDYAPECFLEQHRLYDLDGDGYPEPYICTVHEESQQVVRIVARFDEEGIAFTPDGDIARIEPVGYFTKYSFIPSPDGSFYDIGFGTLLGALSETINSISNQLLDAGHLANVQGGFLGAGISLKSGSARFKPGEWKRVETTGASLKDSIVPLPVKEPSAVLFQMLGMLIEASRDITATKDVLTGDTTPQNQPVGTTLALIEQGLKVYSAIYKRIHRAFKWELAKLRRLNKLYMPPEDYFVFQDVEGVISQQDYATEDVDVIPVSDPTIVMDSQRIGRAQYVQQFMPLPFMNQSAIVKRSLEAANVPDIEELFAKEQGPSPEVMMKSKELEIREREVAIKEAELGIDRFKADTDRMKAEGAPSKTMAETIRTIYEAAEIKVANGLPEIQPPDVSGMAGPPSEPPVLPVPEGPAGQPDGAMGFGPADVAGAPGQGPVDGGPVEPGMGPPQDVL